MPRTPPRYGQRILVGPIRRQRQTPALFRRGVLSGRHRRRVVDRRQDFGRRTHRQGLVGLTYRSSLGRVSNFTAKPKPTAPYSLSSACGRPWRTNSSERNTHRPSASIGCWRDPRPASLTVMLHLDTFRWQVNSRGPSFGTVGPLSRAVKRGVKPPAFPSKCLGICQAGIVTAAKGG